MLFDSGPEVLSAYLAANEIALHAVDSDGFRAWLAQRIREQESDPVFRQKCLIRDLSRRHSRSLRRRESLLKEASALYAASAEAASIERELQRVIQLQKGVEGLTTAVGEGRADPRKLAAHKAALDQARRDWHALVERAPEKQNLDRACAALIRFREAIGLTREEARLQDLQLRRGRQSGTSGSRFEQTAATAIDEIMIPRLRASHGPVIRLSGVTLGCARGEFDHLLVLVPPGREVVDVLAMVEAKRNANDLVDGFLVRQENLAWLTGNPEGYDPELYRTRAFPTGHFDRPARHVQHGLDCRFDRTSFQRFRRDPEARHFLAGLYFVTTLRPLLGVTSRELSTILHWVATDPDFDLAQDSILQRYRKRILSFIAPFQTRDVLELYRRQSLGEQVLFGSSLVIDAGNVS